MEATQHSTATATQQEHSSAVNARSRGDSLLAKAGFRRDVAGGDFDFILRGFSVAESQTPPRGLLLTGGVGCGKTMAARALYPGAVVIDCSQRGRVELLEEGNDFMADKRFGDIILDDFGADVMASNWGVKVSIVAEFLMWRYGVLKAFEANPNYARRVGRLVITTNLDGKEQIGKYGIRVMDRVAELVVGVALEGSSHRKRVTT